MVSRQERRVTIPAERFAGAKTYDEYVASIKVNQAKFADNLAQAAVPEDLATRLRALAARPDGPKRLLVLGEDWCPDVYRGLPVAARIAAAAGIELRVLERDQNLDLMEHFKMGGEYLSIPVLIFLDEAYHVLASWIERPALANEQMREALGPVFGPSGTRQLSEKLGRPPTDEEKDAARAEAQRRYDEFQAASPYWAGWRDATVREVVALLEATLA